MLGTPAGSGRDDEARTDAAAALAASSPAGVAAVIPQLTAAQMWAAGSALRHLPVPITAFDADAMSGSGDHGTAFTAGWAAVPHLLVPPGACRVASTVSVPDGKALTVARGAEITGSPSFDCVGSFYLKNDGKIWVTFRSGSIGALVARLGEVIIVGSGQWESALGNTWYSIGVAPGAAGLDLIKVHGQKFYRVRYGPIRHSAYAANVVRWWDLFDLEGLDLDGDFILPNRAENDLGGHIRKIRCKTIRSAVVNTGFAVCLAGRVNSINDTSDLVGNWIISDVDAEDLCVGVHLEECENVLIERVKTKNTRASYGGSGMTGHGIEVVGGQKNKIRDCHVEDADPTNSRGIVVQPGVVNGANYDDMCRDYSISRTELRDASLTTVGGYRTGTDDPTQVNIEDVSIDGGKYTHYGMPGILNIKRVQVRGSKTLGTAKAFNLSLYGTEWTSRWQALVGRANLFDIFAYNWLGNPSISLTNLQAPSYIANGIINQGRNNFGIDVSSLQQLWGVPHVYISDAAGTPKRLYLPLGSLIFDTNGTLRNRVTVAGWYSPGFSYTVVDAVNGIITSSEAITIKGGTYPGLPLTLSDGTLTIEVLAFRSFISTQYRIVCLDPLTMLVKDLTGLGSGTASQTSAPTLVAI